MLTELPGQISRMTESWGEIIEAGDILIGIMNHGQRSVMVVKPDGKYVQAFYVTSTSSPHPVFGNGGLAVTYGETDVPVKEFIKGLEGKVGRPYEMRRAPGFDDDPQIEGPLSFRLNLPQIMHRLTGIPLKELTKHFDEIRPGWNLDWF